MTKSIAQIYISSCKFIKLCRSIDMKMVSYNEKRHKTDYDNQTVCLHHTFIMYENIKLGVQQGSIFFFVCNQFTIKCVDYINIIF